MSKSGKGSGFERDLAKQLSLWWTGGDRDDVIWRTSQSGGRATQRAKTAVRTKYGHGDLTFTDPIAKPLFDLLVISAKRGYTNTSRPLTKKDAGKFASDCMDICDSKKLPIGKMLPAIRKKIAELFSRTKKSGGVDLLDAIDKPDKKCNVISDWVKECMRDAELAQLPYWWLIFRRDGGQPCLVMPNELHMGLALLNNRVTLQDFGAHCLTISNRLGYQMVLASLEDVLEWCSPASIQRAAKKFCGSIRTKV